MPRPRSARHLLPFALALLAGCASTADRGPPVAGAVASAVVRYAMLPPVPRADPEAPLRRAILSVHAMARRAVGLPPLAWNAGLAADARRHAAYLARIGRLDHDTQDGEGENLWAGTRGAFRVEDMAGDWVREERNFRNVATGRSSRTGRFADVGHYSQMVWRGTTAVGCALATGAREDVLVCRYAPRGNWIGEVAY